MNTKRVEAPCNVRRCSKAVQSTALKGATRENAPDLVVNAKFLLNLVPFLAVLILVVLGGFCSLAQAGGADASDPILARVQRENPSIQSARAKWEAMKLKVPQARAWEDPMFGVDFERMGTTRLDKYTDQEWMLSQQVPVSGKNLSRSRAAEADARANYEEYRRVYLDVLTKARIAEVKLANAYAQLDLNEKNRTLLGQFTEISRVKYEAGTQTQSEVLLAQTEAARLDEARSNLERDIVEQQATLNALMNRPATTPVDRPAPLAFAAFDREQAALERIANEQRPEILMAEKRIDFAGAQLQLAKRQWIPDPQLRIEARHFRGDNDILREYDTGIFISVPWVNFRKYTAGVQEAQKTVESAQHDRAAAKADTQGMIRDQIQKIQTSARNYLLFRDKIVPLAQQTIDATRAGYESDKSGFLELITARRTLQDVESAMSEHLMNYQVAIAELDGIVGRNQKSELRIKN